MQETLSNSTNPLALFHRSFLLHVITPWLQSQRTMREENYAKERSIILRLDRQRAQQWHRRDVRWGLLHAA